jgi:Raf kinase inhibitor-like YbhB/YbcL family protein
MYFLLVTVLEVALMAALQLTSPAFQPNSDIPKKFTCSGDDVSPALSWNDPPAGTQAFALIADDPDAPGGTWAHWVIYDLPASSRGLPEGVPKQEIVAGGGHQGRNDFRLIGYGGPCPPPGSPHRYFFKLYALSAPTGLPSGANKAALLRAMEGKTLAQAELVGKFRR